MQLEELGLIGNCQFSALIANSGAVVWCCLPRFDSEPVFGSLLDPDGGEFVVAPADGSCGKQHYVENSNVLVTEFSGPGWRFRVVDFAPRFSQHDRVFRPTQLLRIVEPMEGTPVIRVRFAPRLGWSKNTPQFLQGSNHIRAEGFAAPLRLTSDVSPTHLDGQPFTLTERHHLVLSWGPPVEEALAPLCDSHMRQTVLYWQRWVKHCNIPPAYQQAVIRSALALKLHCFDDTGAIVAAMTTSIPEAPGSGRTWDYRYCWLRDAYYVLDALRLLGHFEEREQFIQYLIDIAASAPELDLKPLYRIDGSGELTEQVLDNWAGFNGDGPVRIGNAAALHQQHDVFGEMVMALAPIYMDDRFALERSPSTLDLLERLAHKAINVAGTPDAGIWEFRKTWEPQTFSSLMCWAGADRMASITQRHHPARADEFRAAATKIHEQIMQRAWCGVRNGFASTYGGQDMDAALLQMATLRFLPHDDPRLTSTVDAIESALSDHGWLFRYRNDDGLGATEVAFVICTFWLVEALATTGRTQAARTMMDRAQQALTSLGLIAEDYGTSTRRMSGNFPQAYSHVGLIHAAFAASPRWRDVL